MIAAGEPPRRLLAVGRLPGPDIAFLGQRLPAFRLCGYAGLVCAMALSQALVIDRGLSPWVMMLLTGTAVATFLTLAMLTKIASGREQLTYYHHEIAVLATSAAVLALLGLPLLPYLDATLLGVGVFLACGRLGCLLTGCCHGRLAPWGVCYTAEHAHQGFPGYLVGLRLFPVQAVESLAAFAIVVVGSRLVAAGAAPGAALAWYVAAYGVVRFALEFLRGDADRRYWRGVSEAQWTSLLLVTGAFLAARAGWLPGATWHGAAAASMAVVLAGIAGYRWIHRDPPYVLLLPQHTAELLDALAVAPASAAGRTGAAGPTGAITTKTTSLGVQVSAEALPAAGWHYGLSLRSGTMSPRTARGLAEVICQHRHPGARFEIVNRLPGVFHVLIEPAGEGRT